jgi:hypothetical protein
MALAVKRVVTRVGADDASTKALPVRPAVVKTAPRRAVAVDVGDLTLPTEKKKPCVDFFRYATLVYGRPGIGKTTFATSFPDAILLSCERVSKGISCYDFNADGGGVHRWEIFRKAVELLETDRSRFATVVIDTIDAAYAQAMIYACKKMGIDHPHDGAYGKGWDAVKAEFVGTMDRLWATGRGIVFTSHAKEVDVKSHSGEEYTRIQPTMSGQAYAFIKAKTDFVFYAEYLKDAAGNPVRVLITGGDDVVDAKSAGELPRFLPLEKKRGVDLVVRAFKGEDVGLDPATLRAGKQTTKSGGNLIARERVAAIKGK